jgi:hypothetical protein
MAALLPRPTPSPDAVFTAHNHNAADAAHNHNAAVAARGAFKDGEMGKVAHMSFGCTRNRICQLDSSSRLANAPGARHIGHM